jgi:hypothetical protein
MSTTPSYSVHAARNAADRNELGEWVVDFLRSPGSDNPLLADKLSEEPRWWIGPVQVPLDKLHRLAGPSDEPVLVEVDDAAWRDDVEEMSGLIEHGWEPPPVIASWRDGELVLEDGNHRAESLRRAGVAEVWAVLGFDDPEERAP